MATELGLAPTANGVAAPYVPSPALSSTDTLFVPAFEVTRSRSPSRSRSRLVTKPGFAPTGSVAAVL